MIAEFIILLISILLLLVLMAIIVRFSIKLGRIFGIGDFSMTFILMAFATSIPEILIAFVAGLNDTPQIALGTVMGSSIISITLVTGVIALLTRSIQTKNLYRNRQAFILLFMAAFAVFTLLDGKLDRFDGFILITSYFVYLYELWYSQAREKEKVVRIHYSEFLSVVCVLIFSILASLFVAEVLVDSTQILSNKLGLSQLVTGILIISPLVAAPELFFEWRNIQKKMERMSLGDLIGAVGTNTSLVIGIIALISPTTFVINSVFLVILFFFSVSMIMFVSFLYTRRELEVKEGIMLIFIYIAFLTSLFLAAISLL